MTLGIYEYKHDPNPNWRHSRVLLGYELWRERLFWSRRFPHVQEEVRTLRVETENMRHQLEEGVI